MIDPNEISELVPCTNTDVHKLIGTSDKADPVQATRPIARNRAVPHVRRGGRIFFNLPALRQWAAQKLAESVIEADEAA